MTIINLKVNFTSKLESLPLRYNNAIHVDATVISAAIHHAHILQSSNLYSTLTRFPTGLFSLFATLIKGVETLISDAYKHSYN